MRESIGLRGEDCVGVYCSNAESGVIVIVIIRGLDIFVRAAEDSVAFTLALIVFILTAAVGTIRSWWAGDG
jgi:hypothetical protein